MTYALHPAASLLGYDGDAQRSSVLLPDGRISNGLLGISTNLDADKREKLRSCSTDLCELVAALICSPDGEFTFFVKHVALSDDEPLTQWQQEGRALHEFTRKNTARVVLGFADCLDEVEILAPVEAPKGSYDYSVKKMPGSLDLLHHWRNRIPPHAHAAITRLSKLGYSMVGANGTLNPKIVFRKIGEARPSNEICVNVGWYV